MHSDDQTKKTSDREDRGPVCPKCKFENRPAVAYCEICFYPLNIAVPKSKKPDSAKSQSASSAKSEKNSSAQYSSFSFRGSSSNHVSVSLFDRENDFAKNSSENSSTEFKQELQKPSVISGLLVLLLAIALWINFLINRRATYLSLNAGDEIVLYDSMNQVKNVPSGLFSYGGALYFASLLAHGINDAVMQNHPNFNLRYTKPTNLDRSNTNGIKMLLDSKLSFAFSSRSLTEREYAQAQLRDIKLLQIPIAIDGVAFFSSDQILVDSLSLEQVKDIFTGKIRNWQQLGGLDLPIIPVLLTSENTEILGIKDYSNVSQTVQYVSNSTLAIRKVIATPGAISFASASLVQKQQGIKVFNLAEKDSAQYVTPSIAVKPNLRSFQNGTYPLTRRLFIVIRQDGTPDQLAGIAYAQMLLSQQGQEIVEQAGFVPLHDK